MLPLGEQVSSLDVAPAVQDSSFDVWTDWKWQQRHALKSVRDITEKFPEIEVENIVENAKSRKTQITPYYAKLITSASDKNARERLLKQVVPYWSATEEEEFDGITENWELSHEMKTPICQHKYDNRVILRIANVCNAYCQFCFEALRTINTKNHKETLNRESWKNTIDYITRTTAIEEVIFSGGEPLMVDDAKLRRCLLDVRQIRSDLLIRVHSRALTFNPYRISAELQQSLGDAAVNAFGVHVCHPAELTAEFSVAIKRLRNVVPIVFANIPVLKGINDDYETLSSLFLNLYRIGVVPYYLYHFMPFSPGSNEYRASVTHIIRIMRLIKRRKSNIAVPEYVLPHQRGKYTVPLFLESSEFPTIEDAPNGESVYNFTNWLGERHVWKGA